MLSIALNDAQSTHPLTSGLHHSEHEYVTKADILNTHGNIIEE